MSDNNENHIDTDLNLSDSFGLTVVNSDVANDPEYIAMLKRRAAGEPNAGEMESLQRLGRQLLSRNPN